MRPGPKTLAFFIDYRSSLYDTCYMDTKTCSNVICTQANPQSLENYARDSRNKDGRQARCRVCKYAENKKWALANAEKVSSYEESPERKARHKETTYAWRKRNKDKYNSYMRKKNKDAYPEARLQRYGVTRDQHDRIYASQGNVCAICKRANTSSKRTHALDHNAVTGEVRGILCYSCNRALHPFDRPDLLKSIQEYLTNPPARAILKPKGA